MKTRTKIVNVQDLAAPKPFVEPQVREPVKGNQLALALAKALNPPKDPRK